MDDIAKNLSAMQLHDMCQTPQTTDKAHTRAVLDLRRRRAPDTEGLQKFMLPNICTTEADERWKRKGTNQGCGLRLEQ